MENLINLAQQSPPGTVLALLPVMVLDPELEKQASEFFQAQFPTLDASINMLFCIVHIIFLI